MKKYANKILVLFLLCCFTTTHAATTFSNEKLEYQIIYHWGIIWKHAAQAKLVLNNKDDKYYAQLSARTISWADKIYPVRDTLACAIEKDGLRPIVYRKASHEGSHLGLDIVEYSYPEGQCNAKCTRFRPDNPPAVRNLTSDIQAYDMLSVFYYIRTLDFKNMKPGAITKTVVYSGKKKEILTIKYVGMETIELRDQTKQKSHHVKFSFTQEGQKKSSDDMDTWISVDQRHIPLMLMGKLPIGEVRCYYVKR